MHGSYIPISINLNLRPDLHTQARRLHVPVEERLLLLREPSGFHGIWRSLPSKKSEKGKHGPACLALLTPHQTRSPTEALPGSTWSGRGVGSCGVVTWSGFCSVCTWTIVLRFATSVPPDQKIVQACETGRKLEGEGNSHNPFERKGTGKSQESLGVARWGHNLNSSCTKQIREAKLPQGR